MAQTIPLNKRIGRVVAALSRLVTKEAPPTVNLNLESLNSLIQDAANDELVVLVAKAKDKLRKSLSAAVAEVAPNAAAEVADDLEVVIYVVSHDTELLAELNGIARKAGITNAIAYLQAALTTAAPKEVIK
jgi:hypothetical protein